MNKFVTVSVLAMAVVALTGSVALANYGEDNELSGIVKEKGSLVKISKAKVSIYKTNGKKVDSDTTNKKGEYSFDDLTEREYVVKAKASGYRSPKSAKKDSVSSTVKVNGKETKNLYLMKK